MMKKGPFYRVGCDIGGTFTDLVLLNEKTGEVMFGKSLSTPTDPSIGFLNALGSMMGTEGDYYSHISQIAHASTLVANAIIERKGARCALICTKGFRDILEVRRHVRVTTYELWSDPPEPLVPRYLRLSLDERIYADGTVGKKVKEEEIEKIAATIKSHDVESVAICLLHSYVNPENELVVARLLRRFLPTIPITTSSAVLPQIKEYERTSTTVVNAYVRPLVEKYLYNLDNRLREAGVHAPMHIMLSNGGLASPKTAREFPIRLIESGPVAGANIVRHYAEQWNGNRLVAFDMGGTTAKACLIESGEIPITNELEVARSQRFTKSSGYPIAVPGAHLIEIGAGGGSIASINSLGLIQVGPQSAGSEPGPASYGRGGMRPTVTDADLVLGYLDSGSFAGGTMTLFPDRAAESIASHIGNPSRQDLMRAAWLIHDVINETMASAIRMHVAERGGSFDRLALVAFGGAGPVHAFNLGRKLGIPNLIVPLRAGVLSAVGLIVAPPMYDVVKSYRVNLDELDPSDFKKVCGVLETEITSVLRQISDTQEISFSHSVDVGYIGQGHHVRVPVSEVSAGAIKDAFASTYEKKYGYFYDDIPTEVVNIHVKGQMEATEIDPRVVAPIHSLVAPKKKLPRQAYSPTKGELVEFEVYDRDAFRPGMTFVGPTLIEERSSTTVIDCRGTGTVGDDGSLIISIN